MLQEILFLRKQENSKETEVHPCKTTEVPINNDKNKTDQGEGNALSS